MGGKRFRNVSHLEILQTTPIVLKLGGRCKGNMAIQNCSNHSVQGPKMAIMADILKFFK